MDLCGIFKNKNGDYYWMDCLDDNEINKAKYFVDADCAVGFHRCIMSAIYEDVSNCVDGLQTEQKDLKDGELYVVTYFECNEPSYLEQSVDFGLTKEEIVENVEAGKYAEGASYHTIGQMFYTTRKMLEGTL